jgi:hypothetical protein
LGTARSRAFQEKLPGLMIRGEGTPRCPENEDRPVLGERRTHLAMAEEIMKFIKKLIFKKLLLIYDNLWLLM